MKRLLAFITLACICGTAVAADGWTQVASGVSGHFYIKNGSCFVGNYKDDNVGYVRCIEKHVAGSLIYLETVEATAPQCNAHAGILVTRELNGAVVARSSAVFGGGNIASEEFETLCIIAQQLVSP
jgi:hypothetical protein